MKEYVIIILVFAILLFSTPALFNKANIGANRGEAVSTDFSDNEIFTEKINLRLTESDKIAQITFEDYLIGCLFAQIPVNYCEEALKAQGLAARTYALRLISNGAEISDDASLCQPFFPEETAREYYGEEYEIYFDKVKRAARYASNKAIIYEDEPIYAVYHSVSNGVTNTAYSVWGKDFPYLKSVESSWDRSYEYYLCVNEITPDAARLALIGFNKTFTMPVDYSLWFLDQDKNSYGYVNSIKAGDFTLSGGDVWRIFNLRSTSFDISFDGTFFSVETRGYGHGVGLSQYGANVLGERGWSAEEIIKYYYKDVEIIEN